MSDLYGMWIYLPKKYKTIVAKQIKFLKKIIPVSSSQTELFLKNTNPEKILKVLEKHQVDLEAYRNDVYPEENSFNLLDKIRESIEDLEYWWNKFWDTEELTYMDQKINGVEVIIVFCQEDSNGWEAIRLLERLGIWNILYNSIPWDIRKDKKWKK